MKRQTSKPDKRKAQAAIARPKRGGSTSTVSKRKASTRNTFRARFAAALGILSETNKEEIAAVKATTERVLSGQ